MNKSFERFTKPFERMTKKIITNGLRNRLEDIRSRVRFIQKLLFDKYFISFHSVLSESDNLFVSTWAQMQMITEVDFSESSQFVSE